MLIMELFLQVEEVVLEQHLLLRETHKVYQLFKLQMVVMVMLHQRVLLYQEQVLEVLHQLMI